MKRNDKCVLPICSHHFLLRLLVFLVLSGISLTACQKEDFTTSGMAKDHFFLQNEGQNMPVLVAGNVDSKKMLLIIHGGPGGSSFTYREPIVRETVEKECAVVYWDQRYAGMTQGNGGSVSVDVFRDDVKKLILLLKALYGSDQQIYLFAHSWGGFLAPYFLVHESNEQLVKGWIQVDGAHNYSMNDSLTKDMLLVYAARELRAGRNTDFWQEAKDWCDNNDYHTKESSVKLNEFARKAELNVSEISRDTVSVVSPFDAYFSMGSMFSNPLATYLHKIQMQPYDHLNSAELYKLTLPVLLLWGKYDFVCPTGLADDIEANISSTDVQKVLFEHSGHSPVMVERDLFWAEVLAWLRSH